MKEVAFLILLVTGAVGAQIQRTRIMKKYSDCI